MRVAAVSNVAHAHISVHMSHMSHSRQRNVIHDSQSLDRAVIALLHIARICASTKTREIWGQKFKREHRKGKGSQNSKFSRPDSDNREQKKAYNKACCGTKIAAGEDEDTVPSTY